jgi:hypothetical protein
MLVERACALINVGRVIVFTFSHRVKDNQCDPGFDLDDSDEMR